MNPPFPRDIIRRCPLSLSLQGLLNPSDSKSQAASGCPNLADLAHGANGTLELGMELHAVVGTRDAGFVRVDGRVGRTAHLELGELVEVDLDAIVGVLLAHGLDLASLVLELGVCVSLEL